ncbi:hypothetical protein HZC31_08190 [Candidatus Woesearchaeota archaeon]|nr:hypothetical protein [Candidatus Woesearchaeota archaeon]
MRMQILRQLVQEIAPSFLSQVKKELQEHEQKIWEQVIPYYAEGGRFYDMWHIPLSTRFMIALCQKEKLERAVFVSAIMLHDSGYAKITQGNNALKKGNISADERISHMYYGQVLAEDLFKKNKGFGLTKKFQERIKALIATHDNPYIGKPLTTREEKIHRDADRYYVLSFTSFIKDFLRYLEQDPTLSPNEFMKGRICMFFLESEIQAYGFQEKFTPLASDFEKYQKKYEPMFTALGREKALLQLRERMQDIEAGLFEMDEKAFAEYCRKRMEEEMQ